MPQEATGTGAAHPFIIPLTKIDVARRLVIGTAAEEIADKSKEIMDYATARPQFEEWSDGFSRATGGLSKGNLRVMHGKTVAGRLDAIDYDDASKKVQIVAKVSDENEWQKVLDGNYTGFSIGGGYLKKWKDPSGLTRYTPIVREISLVDNPCIPTATFAELVKADGMVEQIQLRGVARGFAQAWAERPRTFAETWVEPAKTFGELHKSTVSRLFTETPSPMAKDAGTLSEAQHRQRVEAAKARWAHENGVPLEHVHQALEQDVAKAGKSLFGGARKMQAKRDEHDRTFSAHADAYEAYDRAAPFLPHGASLMIDHPLGGFYDPTGAMKRMAAAGPGTDISHMNVYGFGAHEDISSLRHDWAGEDRDEADKQRRDGLLTHAQHGKAIAAVNAKHGTSFEHVRIEPRPHGMSAADEHMLVHGRPLGKAASWSESKHPRSKGGRFAPAEIVRTAPKTTGSGDPVRILGIKTGLRHFTPDELKAIEADDEAEHQAFTAAQALRDAHPRQDDERGYLQGAAAGAMAYRMGAAHGPTIIDAVKFGTGERGARNRTANMLRSNAARGSRKRLKNLAHAKRLDATASGEATSLGESAKRKFMEEAMQRGSSLEEAAALGDKFAAKIQTRKAKMGAMQGWIKGQRAATREIKSGMLSAVAAYGQRPRAATSFGSLKQRFLRDAIPAGIAGFVGGHLGEQSAYRLQHEAEGEDVTHAHMAGATVGDVLRATRHVELGGILGAAAALPVSYKLQGGGFSRAGAQQFMTAGSHPTLIRHLKRGALIGALGSVALKVPDLAREYSARYGTKDR